MPKKQVIRKNALVPTVLISGGAGFIGSHLSEFLLDNKARVIIVDNFKTGKEIHVKHLVKNKNFALYDVDINEGIPEEIESVDYIFHLAGLEEYLFGKDYVSLNSLLTNSLGTKNLLDLAEKSDAKFLLASTINVYQGRISQLYLEKYFGKTDAEENKFSLIEAKRFAEAIVWEYFKSRNIDARIVRLPEVYGPRMNLDSSGSLGGFLQDIMDSKPLVVTGDGTEKEFYLHISDAVSGLVKALFNKNTEGNIYSLVPNQPMTVLETVYFVRSLADGELGIKFEKQTNTVSSSVKVPDTFNLKGLSWEPKVNFKDGIVDTLEHFGYSINTHTFKPRKLVEDKQKEMNKSRKGELISLQGLKSDDDASNVKRKIRKKKIKVEWPVQELVNDEGSILNRGYSPNTRHSMKVSQVEVTSPLVPETKKGGLFKKMFLKIRNYRLSLAVDVGYGLSIVAIVVAAGLVFIGIPSLSFYVNAKRGANSLSEIESSFHAFDLTNIERQTAKAYESFLRSRKSLQKLGWVFRLVGKESYFVSYDKLVSSLTHFSKSTYIISRATAPLTSFWEVLRPDTETVLSRESIKEAELLLTSAKNSLGLAEAHLSVVDQSILPNNIKSGIPFYQDCLYKLQEGLDVGSIVFSDLPNILGLDSEKKYVLWFQNSNEIRPTGGFIGSYGVLTLENGKIKNLEIDDIYNPDGQIDVRNIQIEPPEPISEFLEEDRLYLRNSNWDPDFSRSVYAFDDLYFKVTGDEIDGYVAVDLDFVEGLLEATGPVFLAAYNEEITFENLDERAQFYSSFDYEEGSSDKRSFLTVLGSKLLERIFSLDEKNAGPLLNEVSKALKERHLMVLLTNSPVNLVLKENKWDGGLVQTEGDYLSVVNANLGGTKANYHVENKLTYEVSSLTRDGLLRTNLYLDYVHTADNSAWPSGPYTNYVRVLSQDGSKLTGAKVIYDDGSEEDIFSAIILSKVGNYNSFETSFTLDPTKSIRLVFSYDLPQGLSFSKEEKRYDLYWQKQPGTEGDEYFFSFFPPFGTEIQSLSTGLRSEGEQEVFSTSGVFNKDKTFFLLLR